MKILKIFLIVLIPVLGAVSCEKSTKEPCSGHSGKEKTSSSDTQAANKIFISSQEDVKTPITVVGSGDDDRDGGDKKTKKLR